MKDKIINTITNILKKDKNIILAYIFGSFAKFKNSNFKDIDIAIMLRKESRGLEKLTLLNKISSKIENKIKYPIDIVILNQASIALKHQIIKNGKLLFEKKHRLAYKFIIETITKYLDYLDILNFFYKKTVIKEK